MIQQEVSIQDFYDLNRRRELQRIVADVVKNGLPNRDPNWKPKPFVGDPSPKKARTIEDPLKNQTDVLAQQAPKPTTPPPDARTEQRPEAASEAPEHSRAIWLAAAAVALGILGVAAMRFFRMRRR
jgi:hypothetical protein